MDAIQRKHDWSFLAALTVVLSVATSTMGGCGRATGSSDSADKAALKQAAAAAKGVRVEEVEGEANAVRLEHDFGILRPPAPVQHRFAITNSGAGVWSVQKIVNTCGCTAVDLSSPTIAPHKTESITIAYRPGTRSHDDRKNIAVLFSGANAPTVILSIKAKVREPMTVLPQELAFLQLGKGQSREVSFEIQNYSDRVWAGVAVRPTVGWLSVSSAEVHLPATEGLPRQVWRVTVRADATELAAREHRTAIVAQAAGQADVRQEIPVYATVASPVDAIPGQFFFGSMRVRDKQARTITLRFSQDSIPTTVDSVVLEHNVGKALRLAWLQTAGDSWRLAATLNAEPDLELAGRQVTIRFSHPVMPSLAIPVQGMIEK
jgi:hypothetical protein